MQKTGYNSWRARMRVGKRSAMLLPLLVAATALAAPVAPLTALSTAERAAAARVRVDAIRRVTTELASPAMEGRGTLQPGGDRAAAYVADRFRELRLEPLGERGTYFQPVPLQVSDLLPSSRLVVGNVTLEPFHDFVVAPPVPSRRVDVTAPLLFAGFGVVSKELGRDDLAGLDPKGAIVVILAGRPKTVDEAAWKKTGGATGAAAALVARGAAAVLVIAGPADAYAPLADRYGRRRVTAAGSPEPAAPVLVVNDAAAGPLVESAGSSLAELRAAAESGAPVARALDRTATLSLRFDARDGTANNVAAVLRGSDRALAAEAVVFTAHVDAFGRGRDGRIYAGAADNALGVAEMLAVAAALAGAHERPRRSVVFLAVTAEESGLLGSAYWVAHPTWPIARVAANVNFDGVGTETYGPVKQVHGFGSEYSQLGDVLGGLVEALGAESIPDPVPEQGIFLRSDHFSFAKAGVPAINVLGGPGGDTKSWIARVFAWAETSYHQPGDVVHDDWDWEGARTLAAIGLLVGLRVANADTPPAWRPSAPYGRKPER